MPPETLEPARTILTHAPFQSIAWNGRNFLLVLPGETMELVLLSPDGDLVKRGIEIPTLPMSSGWKVVAAGETFWVLHSTQTVITTKDRFGNVTYTFFSTIYAHRVSATGEVLDGQPQVIMDHAGGLSAAVASNGRSILGIALDDRTLRPFAIDATTRAVTVLTTETRLQGWNPIAATDGSRYLLSWTGMNGTLQTLPFDETAAPAAAAPRECCRGADSLPSLAWNGRSYFAAWGDTRDSMPQTSSHHLYGTLVVWAERDANDKYQEVRASLGGAPPVVLSQPALVDATAALSTGSSYFVGWSDRLTWSGTPRVFLRRLGDAAPLPLGAGSGITFAFDGTNVLAVWLASRGLVGQRFAQDGNVVDAVPFVISTTGGFRPHVAWNGSEYLVTWWERTNFCWGGGAFCPPNLRDVNAARVSVNGTVRRSSIIR